MDIIAGIDIGGTKCSLSFAAAKDDSIKFLDKTVIPTDRFDFGSMMSQFIQIIKEGLETHGDWTLVAIGISCGGPLNAAKGLILAPPNLPGWDCVDIFTPLKKAFDVPVMLQNDADACALAEWKIGIGKGSRNMIFLTFGTGMGAGLILNNELYSGSTGMAGEIGHVRMEPDGPLGYGKCGSFEGFCSGGGIAAQGRKRAKEALLNGTPALFCPDESYLDSISCKSIADAMDKGDLLALEIFQTVGDYLGRGIAILIDLLNPELIVIGSIFGRQHGVLEPSMWKTLKKEALEQSRRTCRIVPASLGEMIGDYGAISVGIQALSSDPHRKTLASKEVYDVPAFEINRKVSDA